MHKGAYLSGLMLLSFLGGTLLAGATRKRQWAASSCAYTQEMILRPIAGRLACHPGMSVAKADAGDFSVSVQPPVNLPYVQARPILEVLGDNVPAELKGRSPAEREALWPSWVTRHDQETRARLLRGDEDSLVNFLVMGTSFTRQRPLTAIEFAQVAGSLDSSPLSPDSSAESGVFFRRVDALLQGLANPGNNERLLFLSRLAGKAGYRPRKAYGIHADPAERARLRDYLLAIVARVAKEQERFQLLYEQARARDDRPENVVEVSTLYRSRGLSLDTSLLPNLAVEESLRAMQARGLLAPGSVRRAAVIGPGLDFTDKADGYDFYPEQTVQCFALVDTLLRLGLARGSQLHVTTFDISPRVNDHLRRSRRRAERGQAYVLQLPRSAQVSWRAATTEYWRQFGDQIGTPKVPIRPPALAGNVETRAVQIRPAIVSLISPVDLNIVTQHLVVQPNEGFDLIIATNVFCYFDPFEQSLGLANTQIMLRPGGFLLSNNVLPLQPSLSMRSVDYLSVAYSYRPNDGDVIAWYQRSPDSSK